LLLIERLQQPEALQVGVALGTLGKMVSHEIEEWRAVVKRAKIEGE